VVVERPFDHQAEEGMVSIRFTLPVRDGNTREISGTNVLTCRPERVELDEAPHPHGGGAQG